MSRIERINSELAKQVSIVINQGVSDPRVKGIISVMRVSVDTELTYAKVYVSILGANGQENQVIEGLNHAEGYIKSKLVKMIRLRKMPSLHFIYDDSMVYSEYINKRIQEVEGENK